MGAKIGVELAKRLVIFVVGSLVVEAGIEAAKNLLNGKTITGKKKEPRSQTYVDYKGRVILGTADYEVV